MEIEARVTFAPTISASCNGVAVNCTPASGSFFPIGLTTVTCTAADASLNVIDQCAFAVTVMVDNKCPLTQGYWKNHQTVWPPNAIPVTLGCETYSQSELLAILNMPTTSDASIILARQLIAATLNTANGSNPGPICNTIAQANTLLCTYTGKLPYKEKTTSTNGKQMVSLATMLDKYNNGMLTKGCTP